MILVDAIEFLLEQNALHSTQDNVPRLAIPAALIQVSGRNLPYRCVEIQSPYSSLPRAIFELGYESLAKSSPLDVRVYPDAPYPSAVPGFRLPSTERDDAPIELADDELPTWIEVGLLDGAHIVVPGAERESELMGAGSECGPNTFFFGLLIAPEGDGLFWHSRRPDRAGHGIDIRACRR